MIHKHCSLFDYLKTNKIMRKSVIELGTEKLKRRKPYSMILTEYKDGKAKKPIEIKKLP